jgi:FAD/FMN-containing dehydrogenase
MEYFVAAEDGLACFDTVRQRMKQVHRKHVGWRVLVRTIGPDAALLSPTAGRPSISIAIHQNAPLAYEEFFADIESIFLRFGGRPHWAKVHHQGCHELRQMYAGWETFQLVRRRLDPSGVFLNDYLRRLFGEE